MKERAHSLAVTGIVLSLVGMFFLSLQKSGNSPAHGHVWLVGAMMVFLLRGIQAYFMKSSASSITSESLFLYMAATAVLVAPFALLLTDFSAPINWGLRGPFLTAIIQVLNSIGALLLIYAIRVGKAIIVVPTINGLFPVITIVLSLLIYRRIPIPYNSLGMLLALTAIFLMAYDEVVRQAASSA